MTATIPGKSLTPGQRKFCKPSLFISTSLGEYKKARVKLTSEGVYLPYTRTVALSHGAQVERTGFRRARSMRPASVIAAFEKVGTKVNAHDTAAIYATIYKHAAS